HDNKQHYKLTTRTICNLFQKHRIHNGRQDEGVRNERDVHHYQVNGLSNHFPSQVAGIGLFEQSHPRVLPQAKVNLTLSCVDSDHASCATLQQTICKSARGSADIQTSLFSDINIPMIHRLLQFQTAAAHILQVFAKKPDL